MKPILSRLLALSLFGTTILSVRAQGTAFTYQGSLQNSGSPAATQAEQSAARLANAKG